MIVAKLKKYTEGYVELLDASDVLIARLGEETTEIRRYNHIRSFLLRDVASGSEVYVNPNDIISYQIDPAAPVLFSGDIWDLWKILAILFPIRYPVAHTDEIVDGSSYNGANLTATLNFLIGGGGSGVVENNITAVAGPYTALPTDYIFYATAPATVTLPNIVDVGRVYRFFANNNKVDIIADATDNIIGLSAISIKKWDSLTLRAINSSTWLIGD